jgi:ABC-type transporter Mla subunit MlaD
VPGPCAVDLEEFALKVFPVGLPVGLADIAAVTGGAMSRAQDTAVVVLGVPGRVLDIIARIDLVLTRVTNLVERIERTEGRVDALVTDVAAVTERAGKVADAAGDVATAAGDVADRAGRVATDAGETQRAARGVVDGAGSLLTSFEEPLTSLEPTVRRFAETFSPAQVTALGTLVDRLPVLLSSVDNDVLPLLHKLDAMAPDLHELLETVQDLQRAVSGLPGIGLLKRRGDEELAEDD